jgi:hypothetical protein
MVITPFRNLFLKVKHGCPFYTQNSALGSGFWHVPENIARFGGFATAGGAFFAGKSGVLQLFEGIEEETAGFGHGRLAARFHVAPGGRGEGSCKTVEAFGHSVLHNSLHIIKNSLTSQLLL